MISEKAALEKYLTDLDVPDVEGVLSKFELYHKLLLEKNAVVNLISRATTEGEVWTKHFLDSLFALKCLDFTGKKVLDFGSGGGLPGIPLKLTVPSCRMTLLDSVRKKVLAVQEILAQLELDECEAVCSRLEDLPAEGSGYDFILCRAVRLEERYLKPLHRLLASDGKVLYYKAQDASDIEAYQPKLLASEDFDFGHRALWALEKAQLVAPRKV
jgi:16S rRNA (guanine527-N7)-methyltransferase